MKPAPYPIFYLSAYAWLLSDIFSLQGDSKGISHAWDVAATFRNVLPDPEWHLLSVTRFVPFQTLLDTIFLISLVKYVQIFQNGLNY